MPELTTTYLGLRLKNPLVTSASPLSKKMDTARRLEDAGAAAIVMYSLFEKQITHDGRSALPLWGPRHITFSRILPSCVSPSLWRIRPDGSRLQPILARTPSRFTKNGYYGLSPLG